MESHEQQKRNGIQSVVIQRMEQDAEAPTDGGYFFLWAARILDSGDSGLRGFWTQGKNETSVRLGQGDHASVNERKRTDGAIEGSKIDSIAGR